MSIVNSINRVYGSNNIRAVGKISFNIGERFSGRVVKKIEPASAVIRLGDGLDFQVDVEGDLDLLKEGKAKFEVVGFKDGKLQLKVVKDEGTIISDKLNGANTHKVDSEVMEGMIKFNIPLTKENIKDIKGLVEFISKINDNLEEIDVFIQKYLDANNIKDDSGKLANTLKSFLNEFKNLKTDDILFFIENNLDFDEETIKSFNKLIKSENNELFKNLDNLKNELGTIKLKEGESLTKSNIEINNIGKGVVANEQGIKEDSINNLLAKNAYEKTDNLQNIDIVAILKSIAGETNKNISQSNTFDIGNAIESILNGKSIDNIKNNNVIDILKDIVLVMEGTDEISKETAEQIIGKHLGKEVKLTEENFNILKDALSNKELIDKVKTLIKNDLQKEEGLLIQKDIKEQIKLKGEETKELIKGIIENDIVKSSQSDKIITFIKDNMSEIKLMNKINNEYYYFDSNVKVFDRDYPCKLIIKDNRKDGKQIDSTNVKLVVSIKTINLGDIDAYVKVVDKSMNIDFKCEEDYIRVLTKVESGLKNILEETGYTSSISFTRREKPVNIVNCRGFFNESNRTNLDIKV